MKSKHIFIKGTIFGIFICVCIFGIVYASGILTESSGVSYNNENSGSTASDVQSAIDDLYANIESANLSCGPKETACALSSGEIISSGPTNYGSYTVECTGTYEISIAGAKGGNGGDSYTCSECSYTNPTTGAAGGSAVISLNLSKGDLITYTIGSSGGAGGKYTYSDTTGAAGGSAGSPGGQKGNGGTCDTINSQCLTGGGGGGGGYSVVNLNGTAIYVARGGYGGNGGSFGTRNGGSGGAGGNMAYTPLTERNFSVLSTGTNNSSGRISVSLVDPFFK